jgi:CopG family transcriptional regulator, nickel-responsive regulator
MNFKSKNRPDKNNRRINNRDSVTRISVSLAPNLLKEFDNSRVKAGYSDRSKAIQAALHMFVNENNWKTGERTQSGAGAIVLMYDNHIYNQNREWLQKQHDYSDIISSSTHLHLSHEDCLETIMVKGRIKRIKDLVKLLTENRGIKSLKFHFVSSIQPATASESIFQ